MGFQYDYFYSMETRPYKYFVVPQMLILDEQFSSLSDRAKILYCVMLDRSSMSAKNGWIDERGRIYIIMARDEIMKKMNCSHTTAHKFMQELINFGLIKKRRRGQGKPDLVYVMNFNKSTEAEAEEPTLQEGTEPYVSEGKKPLNQELQDPLLTEAGVNLYSEVKNSVFLGHSGILSPKSEELLSQEVRKPLPQEVQKPLPQEVQKPLPQEVQKPLPQEVQKPLPLEVKKTCPESDLYNNTKINHSSSSDDEYIRQHLGYEHACRQYSEIIVGLLYKELEKRGREVWSKVTPEAFAALCNNVTNYHGKVANVEAYIARCTDNMLIAAAANIASHSPPSSDRSRNQFNNFKQNTYNFKELEEKLLANR